MSDRLVEGLWDCPYCGQKAIGGLEKHCPACGHPQDADTKFYLGEAIKYVDSEQAQEYAQGADWICEYCGSMNRVHYKFCSSCGAPKEKSEHDYFNRKEKKINKLEDRTPVRSGNAWKIFAVIAAIAAIIAIICMPKPASAEITEMSWYRAIEIESLVTVDENDWSIPEGARVYDQRQEIKRYEDVLDHYDMVPKEVAVQVYDGEDTHTEYVDNGDGTFTEHTYTTPRYRTEWETEMVREPVYRSEPVYATKYYYEIDRWIATRAVETSGDTNEPLWGEVKLAKGEREGAKIETYLLKLEGKKGKTYTAELNLDDWSTFNVGDSVKLKARSLNVYEVNGIKTIR